MKIKLSISRQLLNCLLLLLVWIIFAFNVLNRDRMVYELIYCGMYENHEPLFLYLCRLFYHAGFSYQQFYFIIASFCILLLCCFLREYVKRSWIFWLIFIFYPLPLSITVVRSTIVMCLVLYGLKYIESEKRIDVLKFLLIILLACGIHYSAIIYLLFIFAKTKKKNILLVSLILLSMLGVLATYTGLIEKIAKCFIDSPKVLTWFQYRVGWGFVLSFILHMYTYFVFLLGYWKLRRVSANDNNIIKVIYNINSISFLYFIIYIFSTQFLGRIYMVTVVLNYVIISEVIGSKNIAWRNMEKNIYITLVIIQVLLWTIILYGKDYLELFGYLFQNQLL